MHSRSELQDLAVLIEIGISKWSPFVVEIGILKTELQTFLVEIVILKIKFPTVAVENGIAKLHLLYLEEELVESK